VRIVVGVILALTSLTLGCMRHDGAEYLRASRSIESTGGPLVLIPESKVKYWRGIDGSSERGVATDYERACAIEGWAGVLGVKGVPALVIGDEPNLTCISQHHSGLPMIVRWRAARSEDALMDAAREYDLTTAPDLSFLWEVADTRCQLFDSTSNGSDGDLEFLPLTLEPGTYEVRTFSSETNDVWLTIHVFLRQ
jgi:hypothetical protein